MKERNERYGFINRYFNVMRDCKYWFCNRHSFILNSSANHFQTIKFSSSNNKNQKLLQIFPYTVLFFFFLSEKKREAIGGGHSCRRSDTEISITNERTIKLYGRYSIQRISVSLFIPRPPYKSPSFPLILIFGFSIRVQIELLKMCEIFSVLPSV